ncbi:hypothetical protein [Acinetobacter lwoffii]|uniref:hypothetical protein n=1 Tax=Acinetobacter lwoffii TaxID=28090 RepID=UPI003BF76694
MKISGLNNSGCILSSMAKIHLEKGWFDGACIKGKDNNFIIFFTGKDADWDGKPLILSSSRNPFEPRIFKSIDGAAAELSRIGIQEINLVITDITNKI